MLPNGTNNVREQDHVEHQPKTGGIPRGLNHDGPVLWSYGFRPFFLGAGLWAVATMIAWLTVLNGNLDLASLYGPSRWHAHELLFGFAPAALVGYLMTTVPNWTGRFPLSGRPLLALAILWLAGRIAMLAIDCLPLPVALTIDWLFLPVFAGCCARELLAAKRTRDLKPVAALLLLSLFNAGLHGAAVTDTDIGVWARASLSIYVLLITSLGGKLVPSFTNSWLAQSGRKRLTPPRRAIDAAVLLSTVMACTAWTVLPHAPVTTILAALAATCQAARLAGWLNRFLFAAPMIVAMHLSYAFIPLGLAGVAATGGGILPDNVALHLIAIGAVSGMITAIMNRSIRLHTGQSTRATTALLLSSPCLMLAGITRAAADLMPEHYMLMIVVAGLLWIAGFVFFVIDAAPLLIRRRRQPGRQSPPPIRMNIR